jgi:hypothetical protein
MKWPIFVSQYCYRFGVVQLSKYFDRDYSID